MGYAVNGQCYESKINAEDAFFGGSVPIVTAEGSPMFFQRQDDGWYLSGERIEVSFPFCDPIQNAKDGAELGLIILLSICVLVVMRHIARIFS